MTKDHTPQSTSSVVKTDKDGNLVLSSYVEKGEQLAGDYVKDESEGADTGTEPSGDSVSETAPTPATHPEDYEEVKDEFPTSGEGDGDVPDADPAPADSEKSDEEPAPAKKTAAKKTAAKKS